MIISFSDILYSGDVLKKLIEDENPIAAVVDIDWYESYIGRTHHPVSEADNVIMDKDRKMIKIGKNILPDGVAKDRQGEFIGLWKFNPQGISIFLNHFDRLDFILNKTDPFQNSKEWQKSYITDIFQEMIDREEKIHCVLIKKNWLEIDTAQDFLKVGGELFNK